MKATHPGKRLVELKDMIETITPAPKHEIVVPEGWTEPELKRHLVLAEMKIVAEKEAETQRERLAKRNDGFVQLYKKHIKDVRLLLKRNALAADIFLFLMEKMDKHNAVAMSQKVLEEYFDKSRNTIYKALKELTDGGFVCIHRMASASVYTLNNQVVWQSWGNQKQFAEFSGNIVIAKSEQEKIEEKERVLCTKMTRLVDHKKAGKKGKGDATE